LALVLGDQLVKECAESSTLLLDYVKKLAVKFGELGFKVMQRFVGCRLQHRRPAIGVNVNTVAMNGSVNA